SAWWCPGCRVQTAAPTPRTGTGRAPPRWRLPRWRYPGRTARPAACGCAVRRWTAVPGPTGIAGGSHASSCSRVLRWRDGGRACSGGADDGAGIPAAGVSDDAPVEHLDAAGHAAGDADVVGD